MYALLDLYKYDFLEVFIISSIILFRTLSFMSRISRALCVILAWHCVYCKCMVVNIPHPLMATSLPLTGSVIFVNENENGKK